MLLPIILSSLIAQASPVDLSQYEEDGVMTLRGLEGIFANILRVVVALGTIVLFVMLIMGGFNYITAGGDPQKSAAAKKTLTSALTGIALVASAVLIIRIIEEITGVNLSIFRIEW